MNQNFANMFFSRRFLFLSSSLFIRIFMTLNRLIVFFCNTSNRRSRFSTNLFNWTDFLSIFIVSRRIWFNMKFLVESISCNILTFVTFAIRQKIVIKWWMNFFCDTFDEKNSRSWLRVNSVINYREKITISVDMTKERNDQ